LRSEGIIVPISGKFHYYEAGWLFYMRTHKCPICGTILEKANQSLVVNSKSKEAKKYNDFWCGEFRLEGDILVIEHIHQCPSCNQTFSPKLLKTMEKKKKHSI
jgi:uncharacterized protein with PIN domain